MADAKAAAAEPVSGVVGSQLVTSSADIVEMIDKATRWFTLQRPDGRTATIRGPGVRGFDPNEAKTKYVGR